MTHQKTNPTISRNCHKRPRSRYFPPLRPEERTRGALEHSFVAGGLARETAHDYNDQGGEEGKCGKALGARLETAITGARKIPAAEKRRQPKTAPTEGAMCAPGCMGAPGAGRIRRSRRCRRGSAQWRRRVRSAPGRAPRPPRSTTPSHAAPASVKSRTDRETHAPILIDVPAEE